MKTKLKPPDSHNPTFFGMHHSGFFKFFSVSNILQNIVCIALVTYEISITVVALQVVQLNPLDEKIKLYLRAFAWAWFIVHCIVSFGMDVRLFRTAIMPGVPFLRLYSMIQWTSLPLFFILYYTLLLIGGNILPYPPTIANLLLPGHVLYRIYTSYIVFRYSRDIEWDRQMKSGFRNLTEEEIAGFENGIDDKGKKDGTFYETCYEMALFKSYDKKKFEIAKDRLDFNEATTLGCGEFGCVYKVQLLKGQEGVRSSVGVAVKTVDPELSDAHHFKALLTEAKVMTFMGEHENIVQLVGICTSEIRLRKLFIVCELCEFGNLRAHLRSERNTFTNLIARNTNPEENSEPPVSPSSPPVLPSLSTLDLLKWSYEIASGMEFLAEKKIIHGDLAARNILLNSSKIAKITDFGLSRRLYNYSVYVKRNNIPLPWRWLAIESLVDMNFSTASDVWSFGVCCWEIFELGDRPWPDFNVFCSEFIEAIKDGKRMGIPKYSSEEIFALISACWRQEAICRPSFSELKSSFSQILQQFCLKTNVVVYK